MDQSLELDPASRASFCIEAVLRSFAAGILPDLDDAFPLPLAKDSETLQLLRSYVGVLKDNDALAMPELQLVVSHLQDLVALLLSAMQDAPEVANRRGVRVARLCAIKSDVSRDPTDPDLNIGAIAARHGVTPRTVQKLFESEGTTFSQFLLDQRLALAYRMLSDSRHADLSISAIAFDAGFGDLSHFNRAFRRRYGQAPSEVRSSARGEREM